MVRVLFYFMTCLVDTVRLNHEHPENCKRLSVGKSSQRKTAYSQCPATLVASIYVNISDISGSWRFVPFIGEVFNHYPLLLCSEEQGGTTKRGVGLKVWNGIGPCSFSWSQGMKEEQMTSLVRCFGVEEGCHMSFHEKPIKAQWGMISKRK